MSDIEFDAIIDKAAFVVDGYAFSMEDGQVHVLALQAPGHPHHTGLHQGQLQRNVPEVECHEFKRIL